MMNLNFIAINQDLSYSIHDTAKEAFHNSSMAIAKYFNGGIFQTFWQARPIYKYILVDLSNKKFDFSQDKWVIDINSIEHKYYYTDHISCTISDPLGKTKEVTISAPPPNTIEAIIEVFKHLNQYTGFHSWEHYELNLEHQRLIREIEYLKNP